MNVPDRPALDFAETLSSLDSGQVWQYERSPRESLSEIAHAAYRALQSPVDFPPLEAAIVPGDRVAFCNDYNPPWKIDIVDGVLRAVSETEAAGVDIVLWDEADDHTVSTLQHRVGEEIRVVRHESSDRSSLRYLGADQDADPIYLNRRLVDADLVLPIAVGRPLDTHAACDLTGVYPALADASSRGRQRRGVFARTHSPEEALAHAMEPCWLLGVQMMLCVLTNDEGEVCELVAGTPDAIRKRLTPSRPEQSEFPPEAPLVVASLDGGSQQQSWANAARAIASASRYAAPGGTIVLWTDIDQSPEGCLLELAEDDPVDFDAIESWTPDDESEFPDWDPTNSIAKTFQRAAAEYRLLIHSQLPEDEIESIGMAVINSVEELTRLSQKFEACGVLRAAQFAGTTLDSEPNESLRK